MGVINDSQLHFVCISLKLVTKKNFQISKILRVYFTTKTSKELAEISPNLNRKAISDM